MFTKISIIKFIITLFLIHCAAQGPASGGPKDEKGPEIISINPPINVSEFSKNTPITLKFNEMIDPVSVPSSIKIYPEQEWNLKVNRNTVVIHPKQKKWRINNNLRINISRKIRDYQGNKMDKPIQLIYTIDETISLGSIYGQIINIESSEIFEIGLYKWPLTDSSQFIYKVETDNLGKFRFDDLLLNKYVVAGINGNLHDFSKQIRKNTYTLYHENYINLNNNYKNATINLLAADPLKKTKINSFEMISQYYAKLKLSDGTFHPYIIDQNLEPGDTIIINLNNYNNIESYFMPEYKFILKEIYDTIPPYIERTEYKNSNLLITFSEPITITKDLFKKDLSFKIENELKIKLENLSDTLNSISILGNKITDYFGNSMEDSIKIINLNLNENTKSNFKGGNILGSINYSGTELIKIEARNIDSNKTYHTQSSDNLFSITNIPSGYYEIWAFESLNLIYPENYFSGRWEPYEHSANFTFYSDSVEVRALWDVEGIILDFNK